MYKNRRQVCRCDLFDEQQLLAEEERVRQHAAGQGWVQVLCSCPFACSTIFHAQTYLTSETTH